MRSILNNAFVCKEGINSENYTSTFVYDEIIKISPMYTKSNISVYELKHCWKSMKPRNNTDTKAIIKCSLCSHLICRDQYVSNDLQSVCLDDYCYNILSNLINNTPYVTLVLITEFGEKEILNIYGVIYNRLITCRGAYIEFWNIYCNVYLGANIYNSLRCINFICDNDIEDVGECDICDNDIKDPYYRTADGDCVCCAHCAEILIKFKDKLIYQYYVLRHELFILDIGVKIMHTICDIYELVHSLKHIYA